MKDPVELLSYRISLRAHSWGRVAGKGRASVRPGKRCYEAIRGRQAPCEGCPLRGTLAGGFAHTLLSSDADVYEFVSAQRRGDVADVWLLRMRTDMVNALRIEKIGRLAGRASLSPRERDVLELIVRGSQTKEIGAVLGISARTAKFHTANLLRKMGADSRASLLRMLIGPWEPAPITACDSDRPAAPNKGRARRKRPETSDSA